MQVVWRSQKTRMDTGEDQMESKELVQYFDQNLFIANLKAKTKKKALEELAKLFVDNKIIRDMKIVMEMLNQRETLGSTGIGKGVAIPHGRTTAALNVCIAFGKTMNGVEFDSVDKKPVNLIFMVLAPPQDENNRYLPVLGKLVEIVNNRKNRDKLKKIETYEQLVQIIEGTA